MPNGQVIDASSGRPVVGAVVSDGLAVCRTLDDGSFSLPGRVDAEYVFVTVPTSHRALEGVWYADVRSAPDAASQLSLLPRPEQDARIPCRFVQVTDLHVSVDASARLRPIIEGAVERPPGVELTGTVSAVELRDDLAAIVAREHPAFIAATGDLADYGQPEELRAYRDVIEALGVPVASLPGNHDHLSCLSPEARAEFARWFEEHGGADGESYGAAFQRRVFGGDWRRATSGRIPWLDVIGPLYYSFDWAGVHIVAYDGEGRVRYGDDYPQDRWLAADLALVDPATPVVVLTHFPESNAFYRERFGGVRLVASFAGHTHGSRVWSGGGARHWVSATSGFGGTDYSPRGYRVVEVEADDVRVRWEGLDDAARPPPPRVGEAIAVANDIVLITTEAADDAGTVQALGRWSYPVPSAARGGVVSDGQTAFALGHDGLLVALDVASGAPRWTRELGGVSERWILAPPTVHGDRVYAGSTAGVHAFDASSGAELWRTALGPGDWTASCAGVAVGAGVVVLGAVSDHVNIVALEEGSGALRWRHDGREIAGVTATPVIVGDVVVAISAPGWLRAYELTTGVPRWVVALDEPWPVALVVDGSGPVVRSATGVVSAYRLENGEPRWTRRLRASSVAARPYSRSRGGRRVPMVLTNGAIWTVDVDALVRLDPGSGEIVRRVEAEAEIVSLTADVRDVVAVTATHGVTRTPC